MASENHELTIPQQILVLLLEQQQWHRCLPVANWLAVKGDISAAIVKVEVLIHLQQIAAAQEALIQLPSAIRKLPRVRWLEARIVFLSGSPSLAKEIYISSLDKIHQTAQGEVKISEKHSLQIIRQK